MRHVLRSGLTLESDGFYVIDTIRMLCSAEMTSNQVSRRCNDFSDQLTRDGSASIAGIIAKDVDYLANTIHRVAR